jgi:hypothetical protein
MSNSSSGVFDSATTHDYFFIVSRRIFVIVEQSFWLRFREFTAPATAAASGGGSTSTSASTPSGGGSTSGSGGSSSPTSDAAAAHRHMMFAFALAGPISSTVDEHNARDGSGTPVFVYFGNGSDADLHTWTADGAHSHLVTVPAHTHSTPAHTHPAHDHDVPSHTHGLTYGIFKEPMPASIDVNIGLWHKPFEGGSWTLLGSISGIDEPEVFVDLTSFVPVGDPSGLYRLTFQSAPGQPQGGR